MMRRLVIATVVTLSTGAGLFTSFGGGSPAGVASANLSRGCDGLPAFVRGAPGLASGRAIWAVAAGRLVSLTEGRTVADRTLASIGGRALSTSMGGGTIKHVAARPGVGTAFVIDRAGADVVVALTGRGVELLPQRTEASHPAWSADGRLAWSVGSAVVVRDPASGETDRLAAPIRGASVFAPAFLSDRRIAAVVSVPTQAGRFEGEQVGNLWARPVAGGSWRRLTDFRAGGDRWVTVRTPIAGAGGIDFVRVSARASSTRAPTFELWRYDHGSARRVRRLDGERYLAGRLRGRLVWNRPDAAHGRHLLQVEEADAMRTIGCGAVLVDPVDVVDPDRAGRGSYVPERGERSDPGEPGGSGAVEIAVIVGDFQTASEAGVVATEIRSAYQGSLVQVVDHEDAPLAIRPGVFGALLHLAPDADPSEALAAFRAALPAYTSNSWIVTP